MNIVEIEKKIRDRLSAAPLAAATQGAFNTIVDGDASVAFGSKPLIVFTLVSGTYSVSTFAENMGEAVYQVSVFDHRSNGLVNLMDVVSKVFGDSGGGLSPTYGLDRWKITGMTHNTDCRMEAVDFGTQHTEAELHYWQTFRVIAQEA